MSFAEDVKNELCQYEASSDADVAMKIEASCLLRMGGSIILGMKGAVGIRLATANNAVARRLLGILKKQYELPTNVLVRQGLNLRKKNMYTLSVEPSIEGRQALEDLALWPVTEQIPRSWLKSMEARRAFLRGAFLGGGSVNKPQSDYHLEFMTGNENFAKEIIHVLRLFHIHVSRTVVTIIILLITCAVYTYAVLHGFKGISFLAKLCIYLFFGLLVVVLVFGGQGRFIIENGIQSLGKMVQNFIGLATYTDPVRANHFPQDWTIYYWAYWMVWCVAAPFFIGNISKGRTIKQTILGGYVFGVGSTIVSFIVLGNYSLGLQVAGRVDFIAHFKANGDLYDLILNIIQTMPCAPFILILTFVCMIAFYATSFDSIAYTAACYSYKELGENEHPHTLITLLWCVLLIVLPIALVFSESSMGNIQSISIISAFPIGIIMILMIWSFFKDAKKYISKSDTK